MLGLMMNTPLLVSTILRHAENYHRHSEIVSRTVEGPMHRYTYGDMAGRAKKVANALVRMGLEPGDRVGTLAWNGYRHMELYYGISGAGYVCHTINPRLFSEQIDFIIRHADDRVIFVDTTFVPILEGLADTVDGLLAIVVMTDRTNMPSSDRLRLICYEELIAAESDVFDWPDLDENAACGLCYTSGTSGAPKGVLYSHRSTVLHAMASGLPDVVGISVHDVICPVVPMFHVNAWGLPYAALIAGAKLVLAGPQVDGASLHGLFETERVTITAGVPTVWMGLLDWMDAHAGHFSTLERAIVGGSAPAPNLITRFRDKGVQLRQFWGMTELSPIGLMCVLKPNHDDLPEHERLVLQAKQGAPVFGVEFFVEGADGNHVPRDGKTFGTMMVRGPYVISAYYNVDKPDSHKNGWFDTSDVVTIDDDSLIHIVDRNKDVVKSGGEWISSIELENIAQSHPAIQEAAVVARDDPKWSERPVLVVQLRAGATLTRGEMQKYYSDKTSKWSIPDDIMIVDKLPHTATGKLLKTQIREMVKQRYAEKEGESIYS